MSNEHFESELDDSPAGRECAKIWKKCQKVF